ncbi:MAG: hypothetical protein ABIT16_12925 [Croceibacterium sp.]
MAGERLERALARIDAAAGRITAAVRSPVSPGGDNPELARKYAALQAEAGAALAQLDSLIEAIEP